MDNKENVKIEMMVSHKVVNLVLWIIGMIILAGELPKVLNVSGFDRKDIEQLKPFLLSFRKAYYRSVTEIEKKKGI